MFYIKLQAQVIKKGDVLYSFLWIALKSSQTKTHDQILFHIPICSLSNTNLRHLRFQRKVLSFLFLHCGLLSCASLGLLALSANTYYVVFVIILFVVFTCLPWVTFSFSDITMHLVSFFFLRTCGFFLHLVNRFLGCKKDWIFANNTELVITEMISFTREFKFERNMKTTMLKLSYTENIVQITLNFKFAHKCSLSYLAFTM